MTRSRAWTLFLGSCLLFAADAAPAQLADLARSTPEQRANAQTAFMKSKLALDAPQLEKLISADQFETFNASKDEMRKAVTAKIQREVKAGAASP